MEISLAKYQKEKERASKITDEISRTAALSALEIMWLRQSFSRHRQIANQYMLRPQEDPEEEKRDAHRMEMINITTLIMGHNEKLRPYMNSHAEIYSHIKTSPSLAEAVYSQIVGPIAEDEK